MRLRHGVHGVKNSMFIQKYAYSAPRSLFGGKGAQISDPWRIQVYDIYIFMYTYLYRTLETQRHSHRSISTP